MQIDLRKIEEKKAADHKGKTAIKSIAEHVNSVLNKDIAILSRGFKDKKKQQLYNDLSMLLSSGIDIHSAFDILIDNFKLQKDKALIKGLFDKVKEGATISEAFESSGRFSTYEYYSIKIGEESGRLNQVLEDLTSYYNKKVEQKRKLIGAFTYPIIVVLTALLAVGFMLQFIVPMFEEIYKRFDKELPGITKFIIKISHQSGPMLIGLLLVFIIAYVFAKIFKDKHWFISSKDWMLLRIPLFGSLLQKIYIARLSLSMELLLGAKLPLLNAVSLSANMIKFSPLKTVLNEIEQDLLQGKSFHQSIKDQSFFDKRIKSLVKVGEEVNQLDETFHSIKEMYQKEAEHKTAMISSILEPLLIVFIGVFVAVILVSMYLPIFKISTSIGQ